MGISPGNYRCCFAFGNLEKPVAISIESTQEMRVRDSEKVDL
jgi:hypothetical protein